MADNNNFKTGDLVRWKWLGNYIEGQVEEVYFKPISKIIKGKTIKRNGSNEKPAYLVKSEAGNLALKLMTELEARTASTRAKYRPPKKS